MICHRMKSIMYTGSEELDEQEELDVLFLLSPEKKYTN